MICLIPRPSHQYSTDLSTLQQCCTCILSLESVRITSVQTTGKAIGLNTELRYDTPVETLSLQSCSPVCLHIPPPPSQMKINSQDSIIKSTSLVPIKLRLSLGLLCEEFRHASSVDVSRGHHFAAMCDTCVSARPNLLCGHSSGTSTNSANGTESEHGTWTTAVVLAATDRNPLDCGSTACSWRH